MIIGVAGMSASGKTTFCTELIRHLPGAQLIHFDDYWHLDRIPTHNGIKNWELPQNLNFERIIEVLTLLQQHESAKGLRIVREEGKKSRQEDIEIIPSPFIIVEGFLLFYDSRVCDLLDMKIYLDIDEETSVTRRLTRGRSGRNDAEHYYREFVVKEYRQHGLPTKDVADIVLDATKNIEENVKIILQKISDYPPTNR